MFSRIEVTHESDSGLFSEVWTFRFNDTAGKLVLDEYTVRSRQTRRHKWVTQKEYKRLPTHTRNWDRGDSESLELADVPFPATVAQEAKRLFCERIQVVKE